MSLLKRRFSIPVVLAATVAALVVTAAPAHAVYQRGQCQSGDSDYIGTGWSYYNYTGGYDVFSFYEYYLTAGGNQSDLTIRQYSGSTVIYSWGTGSTSGGGGRKTHVPSTTVRVPGSANTRTGFAFIFDKNNDVDPRCTAYTPWW